MNSARPPQAPTPAPARPLPSVKPALIVVAVAVTIVLLGSILALVGTPSARPVPLAAGPHRKLAGSRIEAEAARSFLTHIETAGEPPADVVSSLLVPVGSRYLGKRVESRGISQFDSSVSLSVPYPEQQVRTFFLQALSAGKWVSNSVSAPRQGTSELIAERSGSDGYQWRVGIVTTAVHTLVSPALAGNSSSPARTRVSIQLYQVGDAS